MKPIQRAGLIEAMMSHGAGLSERLESLGISRSTYYVWKGRYDDGGVDGLERRRTTRRRFWNALSVDEEELVLRAAMSRPEHSPRLIALRISDEEDFTVSESTVFRILKKAGLVRPRPYDENPAGKQWKHRTSRCDEIWQTDAKNILIPSWGRYKTIPVIDDYSRKCLALPLMPDETSYSISDAVEIALENSRKAGHTLSKPPVLLSDNGPGFVGEVLAKYLKAHDIRQIHGAPYHPQTQGKVERFNRKIAENVLIIVRETPDEVRAALLKYQEEYNNTPHEALKNVTPDEMYAGRQEEILKHRAEKKRITMLKRRERNRKGGG